MSTTAIKAEHLSKRYLLGRREAYRSLRDVITRAGSAPFRWASGSNGQPTARRDAIWAVDDVSFEVAEGEALGLIGRNGAGKSTLLKILSRITRPTSGTARIAGRVGSLLEVGTGFHFELTGRENVYLNGAMLGMRKAEIDRKFNEIVGFAEVERFIDTPLKFYSTGMRVRLAFAVAAHLEPEILIIDEVLAVGDYAFQERCLGKMGDIAHEGRTVLFVSHNLQAISTLCSRAVLLDHGHVVCEGKPREVVARYLSREGRALEESAWEFGSAPGTDWVKLRAVRVLDSSGRPGADIEIDEPVRLEMEFWILRRTRMTPSFHIYNGEGALLFAASNLHLKDLANVAHEPGLYRCECIIPANFLNDGDHYVSVHLTRDNNASLIEVRQDEVVSFRVQDTGTSRGDFLHEWLGLVRPLLPWNQERISDLV